ncbi:sugar phosphate isomerase/epimerase family protein [Streptomyces sp. NPDC048442]|uniref:sugar phosphate isomerase/epimerase family protein n=1 Tax=Streptomyces sp. NPDC048442 TaxID=3154823 RepID=UPI00344ACCB1
MIPHARDFASRASGTTSTARDLTSRASGTTSTARDLTSGARETTSSTHAMTSSTRAMTSGARDTTFSTPDPATGPRPPLPLPLRFAYGTNGFARHSLEEALRIIADIGYEGVSLTLARHHLDPYAPDAPARVARLARLLDRLGLAVVVETGDPHLLDPSRPHLPGLLCDHGSDARSDLISRAVRVADALGADTVHVTSGSAPDGMDQDAALDRLAAPLRRLLATAQTYGITLALEPEPEMFLNGVDRFLALRTRLDEHPLLRLTLDVGHAHCSEPRPLQACVELALPHLAHVQIEDMVRGVHRHLPFGTGEIDFPPVLHALAEGGHRGLVSVEIQDGSADAARTATRSLAFLKEAARVRETA